MIFVQIVTSYRIQNLFPFPLHLQYRFIGCSRCCVCVFISAPPFYGCLESVLESYTKKVLIQFSKTGSKFSVPVLVFLELPALPCHLVLFPPLGYLFLLRFFLCYNDIRFLPVAILYRSGNRSTKGFHSGSFLLDISSHQMFKVKEFFVSISS